MRDPAARMLKERQPDEPRTDQIEQFNAQLERLRLAAVAGGKESHGRNPQAFGCVQDLKRDSRP
jgi:hypothetical protein